MCSKRIEGDSPFSARPERESEDDVAIDPEKFKKILRVDESDESEKRRKQQEDQKKAEDEKKAEEQKRQEAEEAENLSTTTDFAELMEDKEDAASIFESQSAGKQYRRASTSSSPYTPSPYSTEEPPQEPSEETLSTTPPEEGIDLSERPGEELKGGATFQKPGEPQEEKPLILPLEENGEITAPSLEDKHLPQREESVPTPPKKPSPEKPHVQEAPPSSEQKKEEVSKAPSEELTKQEKKKLVDTSLLATQPKKGALISPKKKKEVKTPEVIIKEIPKEEAPPTDKIKEAEAEKKLTLAEEVTSDKPIAKKEPTDQLIPPKEIEKKPGEKEPTSFEKPLPIPKKLAPKKTSTLFRRLTPQEVREKKKEKMVKEKEKAPPLTKEHQRPSFIEVNKENAGIPLPPSSDVLPSIQPSEISSYSTLSPEIYELFERISGVILIQNESGITTTTVTLNMPDTVFNGSQIVLDQYSTAPNAFNIQLVGSPEAIKMFAENMNQLSQAFEAAKYTFEAHLLPPILQTETKKPFIRRKGSAKDQNNK